MTGLGTRRLKSFTRDAFRSNALISSFGTAALRCFAVVAGYASTSCMYRRLMFASIPSAMSSHVVAPPLSSSESESSESDTSCRSDTACRSGGSPSSESSSDSETSSSSGGSPSSESESVARTAVPAAGGGGGSSESSQCSNQSSESEEFESSSVHSSRRSRSARSPKACSSHHLASQLSSTVKNFGPSIQAEIFRARPATGSRARQRAARRTCTPVFFRVETKYEHKMPEWLRELILVRHLLLSLVVY
ncbi:hypothetical protein C8R46DRAFT_534752 [Mycena filopes]|nr:hypothetical protein C8R46DRAFT_534752 [Mycena filopes]